MAFILAFSITLCHDISSEDMMTSIDYNPPQVLVDSPRVARVLDDEIQIQTERMRQPVTLQEEIEVETEEITNVYYSSGDFQYTGVLYWNGWRWTWYSQRVLPGDGLNIPGRHVDDNGYICDGDGYICLASSTLDYGTIVDTPFGKSGKVYDSGCDSDVLDVYVDW